MDGVADAGDPGDLLSAWGGSSGGIAATEVVRVDGVVPIGLVSRIAVVCALDDNKVGLEGS